MSTKDEMARFVDELRKLWPVARGSLCEVAKPCVRAGCGACARGDKHASFIFSYRKGAKQRCLYVPRELAPELQRAVDNGRWVENRMTEIGEALIFEYRHRRDARPPPRRRRRKAPAS
jgi:Family of unknown function (DUF6788)